MATIEERANRYAPKAGYEDGMQRLAYIRGAEEQQKIDMVRFSLAFCDNICSPQQRLSCDMRKVTCTKLGEFLQQGLKEE